jgi:hypothetical protein
MCEAADLGYNLNSFISSKKNHEKPPIIEKIPMEKREVILDDSDEDEGESREYVLA